MANVTLDLDEYNKLKGSIDEINATCTKLREELNAARTADPSGRVEGLNKLARALLKTLQFSTANLNPRDIKRWPHDALREVADNLKHLADHSPHDTEHATMLHAFADECVEWEEKRKANPEREVPPPFPMDQHPIAQMMTGMGSPGQKLDAQPGASVKTDPAAP